MQEVTTMGSINELPAAELPHKLMLDGRSRLNVSGVKDVESFDEAMIVLITVRGTLVVRGQGLHLKALSLEGGEVAVDGVIDALTYEDDTPPRRGLFGRIW